MKNAEIIETFLHLLQTVERDLMYAKEMQAEEERKTQDILHMIELENLTYVEKGRLMKRLESVRRDRRRYKDAVEELVDLVAFVQENKAVIHKIEALLGKVRNAEKKHKNRMYVPRTDICVGVHKEKSMQVDSAECMNSAVMQNQTGRNDIVISEI